VEAITAGKRRLAMARRRHVIQIRIRVPAGASAREYRCEARNTAGQARAIRNARPPTFEPSWRNRQERIDKIPQTDLKNSAAAIPVHGTSPTEDQISEVLLHALKALITLVQPMVARGPDHLASTPSMSSARHATRVNPLTALRDE
jgi:hypothetical protein